MIEMTDPPAPTSTATRLTTTPTVVAPGLAAAGVETCLGSTAGGLSLMGGGFTFGSTRVDEGCTIRLLARQLFAFGLQKAAIAVMCQEERVAIAMFAVGTPCPAPPAEVRDSDRDFFRPVFAFAPEAWTEPLPPQPEATSFTQETEIKPLSQEEQRLFDRTSNMK